MNIARHPEKQDDRAGCRKRNLETCLVDKGIKTVVCPRFHAVVRPRFHAAKATGQFLKNVASQGLSSMRVALPLVGVKVPRRR
jgi:hypothetical protein